MNSVPIETGDNQAVRKLTQQRSLADWLSPSASVHRDMLEERLGAVVELILSSSP
jgi:hypothetical protein